MKPAEQLSNGTEEPVVTINGSDQLAGGDCPLWSGSEGDLPAGDVVIVASRYHATACDSMVAAAIDTLVGNGFTHRRLPIVRVPGAWELPLAVRAALARPETIAAIAIGVVIRGETTHDEHINRAVSLELMRIGSDAGKPVGLGLLTCNTPEQVAARTGGELGNKGDEAAAAAIEMIRLIAKLRP